ncbi:ADC synthase [Aspergillus ambiguus]|uniref:aminodeoxychorismate synthase pabA n=1 Tax=Aspergillus ambiguus TaxID=176160 RepID=UPI003CCDFD89
MAPLLGAWGPSEVGNEPNGSRIARKNILYVDAYDSFSYNVVAMLEEVLDVKVTVMMIDSEWPDANMVHFLQHYEAVVLGPGPGDPNVPQDIGIMKDIWSLNDADLLPVFGICLGFQTLCLHQGISIERLPYPLHGQVHRIYTNQKDIFESMPEVEVTLYHSLYAKLDGPVVGSQSRRFDKGLHEKFDLDFLAWLTLDQGVHFQNMEIPMAVRHRQKPFWGVQFHPESCKSNREACAKILKRWWALSLLYNKMTGRGGYGCLPEAIVQQSSDMASLSDVAYTMLNWSSSTSRKSAFRTIQAHHLSSEDICERLNVPGSPTVLFQSNGKYSIISAPSPTGWRIEYYAQTGKLLLEKLPTDPNGASGADAAVEKLLSVSELWDVLRYVMDMKHVLAGDPTVPFWGGFLGYFSYELGLACLNRPKTHNESYYHRSRGDTSVDDPADVSLLWTERSVVLDNETGKITVQSIITDDDLPGGWLDEIVRSWQFVDEANVTADSEFLDSILRQGMIHFPEEKTYLEQVKACQTELKAGESYELCLTCETSITLPSPSLQNDRVYFPWELYKRLRQYNPAAFSAYAKLGNVKVVSSSPECFLNWDRSSTLEMKPMKGTVRKSDSMTLDKAKEILGSTKEMAENLMIADLIRHDLYGICGSGGVHVEKLLEVEDHGRVYQMITHVKGSVDRNQPGFAVRGMPQLRQSSNMSSYGLTALQRCLPPGSMTGAPKERSCMHLSSIEARDRGIYSGVMGFLDLGGGGSFSVLIRTAFSSSDDQSDEQKWRIGAGGAVTILSTAEGEWDEMLTKLKTVCGIFSPLTAENAKTGA